MPDMSATELERAIRSYYERWPEENRLQWGAGRLEALRTRSVIERHAAAPPATVLDVGGAAGAYASWLAEAGYTVHLIDAVPRLVAAASRLSASLSRPIASCGVGDARALAIPRGFADVVLLLGPLYHLTTESGRSHALAEATRVLKPGGMLFAAAISRWASALDGLTRNLLADPQFAEIVERDLRDGQHRNPGEQLDYFTTAYFHRPEELRAEVVQAGLVVDGLYGLEGPNWLLSDFEERWADPQRRSEMVRVAEMMESEPSTLGISAHLLVVARKPSSLA
jgi:2-polyprenyl-3-methyl-5-hydroxy-6-metoxy-1,4-benzoquinol methylase